MKKVAFICVHNSCRSQIAEALCRVYRKDLIPYSAGTEIKKMINEDAIRVMKEKYEIDISTQYPKLLKDIPVCDIYISMGCNVSCPMINRDFDIDFNIDDPTGCQDEVFIRIIEEIKNKIFNL